eukprot:3757105-Prymnesium_polylepis.1
MPRCRTRRRPAFLAGLMMGGATSGLQAVLGFLALLGMCSEPEPYENFRDCMCSEPLKGAAAPFE